MTIIIICIDSHAIVIMVIIDYDYLLVLLIVLGRGRPREREGGEGLGPGHRGERHVLPLARDVLELPCRQSPRCPIRKATIWKLCVYILVDRQHLVYYARSAC